MKESSGKTIFDRIHLIGRIGSVFSIITFAMVGVLICWYYDIFPSASTLIQCLSVLLPLLGFSAIMEFLSYLPKLGSGATYISFITGNVSNMKAPSILAVFEIFDVKDGTEEKELFGIIVASAASLLVIVLLGILVLFSGVIAPVLEWGPIQPAFSYIMPAIIGTIMFSALSRNTLKYTIPSMALCFFLSMRGVANTYMAVVSAACGFALYFLFGGIDKMKGKNKPDDAKQ